MGIFLSNNPYTNNDYQFQASSSGASVSNGAGQVVSKVSIGNSSNVSISQNTVSGEIVEKNGDSVIIKLSNDAMLEAKLSGNVNVSVGQKLSFEVLQSANNQINLRPLFSNLSSESGIVSALKNAGLPINDITISMTDKMMQEGMNVGKNSLTDMYKDVSAHRNVSVETVVQINKLNMPITELNLTQFENYRNFEHRITSDIMTLADEVTGVLDENFDVFASDNQGNNNVDILNQIMEIAGDDKGGINVSSNISDVANKINELMTEIKTVLTSTDLPTFENDADVAEVSIGNFANEIENLDDSTAVEMSDSVFKTIKEATFLLEDSALVEKEKPDELLIKNQDTENISSNDKESVLKAIKNELNSLDILKPDSHDLTDGNNNLRDLISELRESINGLVKSDDFKNLLKDSIKDKLTLEPKDVAKEGKIEELYEKIRNTSNKVIDLTQTIGKQDSAGSNAAQNLNNNINFMNKLNEFVNYVQLPLKMAGENAHGDLCVYTKKKNLNNNDGNYSALLHLDMEHLGPMDIYVTMRNHTKINTNFYLESEELLDFIESHIDELTARLNQKGYETGVTVSKKDAGIKPIPITDEFTKNESGNVEGIVSKLSFDVRA